MNPPLCYLHRSLLGIVLIQSLVGCNGSSRDPQAPTQNSLNEDKQPADPPPRPSLQLVNYSELSFTKGSGGHVWTMKGYGLKRLTAKLILISEGSSHTIKEADYRWDKACQIEGQLAYLLSDGEVFGAKDKHLPSLSVSFLDVTSDERKSKPASSATTSSKLLEGDWNLAGSSTLKGVGKPSEPADIAGGILHTTSFKKSTAENISYETSTADLNSYVEASKKGVTFVMVILESERF